MDARAIIDKAGTDAVEFVNHLGASAVFAALHSTLRERFPTVPPAALGILYGTALSAAGASLSRPDTVAVRRCTLQGRCTLCPERQLTLSDSSALHCRSDVEPCARDRDEVLARPVARAGAGWTPPRLTGTPLRHRGCRAGAAWRARASPSRRRTAARPHALTAWTVCRARCAFRRAQGRARPRPPCATRADTGLSCIGGEGAGLAGPMTEPYRHELRFVGRSTCASALSRSGMCNGRAPDHR